MVRVPHLRTIAAGLALGLLAGACTSDEQPPPPTGPTGNSSGMVAVAASIDLYRGDPQRLAFGLIMPDNSLVSFGTVDVAFSLVGSAAETAAPEPGPTATATFVPTFGMPDASSGPVVTSPTEGRGVYQATDVVFDTAGFWVAEVTADIKGSARRRRKPPSPSWRSRHSPRPATRRRRPRTSPSTPRSSARRDRLESGHHGRDPGSGAARVDDRPSDPGRPAGLAVFATPVFCVSRFCGPVTKMVEELAHRYDDRAVFVHVEIWEDHDTQVLNQAAIDWLQMPNGELTEPWLFLIGADGRVVDRWSSMWSEAEVEAELEALPPMKAKR